VQKQDQPGWRACLVFLISSVPLMTFAAEAPDPADQQALESVCGKCHQSRLVLESPRSASAWLETIRKMAALGATGTDEELDRVIAYVQRNLTIENVSTSPD
jgi:mono/diheme cytochrome c family protein